MTLLEIITPTNIKEERKKFFTSSTYNPIFKYKWETKGAGKLYQSKKSDLKRAVISQNHDDIVRCAEEYFDTKVDNKTLAEATENTIKTPERPSECAADLIKSFQQTLKYFDISYRVVLSKDSGFNIRPQHTKQRIIISETIQLDFYSIDAEIKHEMTHILRYQNEQYNRIPRDKNYLPTEEGLASYLGDYHSTGRNASLFQHGAEYLATEVGLAGSLRNIFDYFISIGFPKELAWQRSIRHKFGFKDTSKLGDIMKPAMYFHHEQKIRKLDKDALLRLFVGKISLDSLEKYPKYAGLIPEKKIISFFNL